MQVVEVGVGAMTLMSCGTPGGAGTVNLTLVLNSDEDGDGLFIPPPFLARTRNSIRVR